MDSGTLASEPTADLLRRLANERATGCLRIEQEATQATVYFRQGMVYTASAPAARARLGDRLVGAGHVSEEQLAETLAAQRSLSQPRRIGELLIERGLIDRETMRTYVREQIADSVAAVLRWGDGRWSFAPGDEVPEDAPLDVSVENLLMEGARRLEEWTVISKRLGSVDAVVDFAAGSSAAELSLTPDEWSMLTRIDGASSIAEIADEAGYSQFEAARIIYGLLTAGVVALVDPAPPAGAGTREAGADTREEGDLTGLDLPGGGRHSASRHSPDDARPDDASSGDAPAPPHRTRPEDAPAPADAAAAGEARPVNRNELLREFAALDDDDEAPPVPPTPARPVPPPAPREERPVPPPEPERPQRRGIFRRRRD